MEELKKMNRIIDREFSDAHRENLIVLDGTTGQNALMQAKEFGEVADLTGIILTKMDGTAKGGIAVAIQSELNVPVKYIGVGESIDDLQKFNADDFVNALFDIRTKDAELSEESDEQGEIADTAKEEETANSVSCENNQPELEKEHITETDDTELEEECAAVETDSSDTASDTTDSEQIENDDHVINDNENQEENNDKPKKKKWFFW